MALLFNMLCTHWCMSVFDIFYGSWLSIVQHKIRIWSIERATRTLGRRPMLCNTGCCHHKKKLGPYYNAWLITIAKDYRKSNVFVNESHPKKTADHSILGVCKSVKAVIQNKAPYYRTDSYLTICHMGVLIISLLIKPSVTEKGF